MKNTMKKVKQEHKQFEIEKFAEQFKDLINEAKEVL